MAAGLMVGPEKNERVNVRNEPKTEEAMVAVLMVSLIDMLWMNDKGRGGLIAGIYGGVRYSVWELR